MPIEEEEERIRPGALLLSQEFQMGSAPGKAHVRKSGLVKSEGKERTWAKNQVGEPRQFTLCSR
jgi:hypothetical protein